nr:unnamed protein product [Callosobruchus analis]
MPKYQVTWDPHPVLLHLSRLYPLEELSRLQLAMKLVTLLALITGQRIQTKQKFATLLGHSIL